MYEKTDRWSFLWAFTSWGSNYGTVFFQKMFPKLGSMQEGEKSNEGFECPIHVRG